MMSPHEIAASIKAKQEADRAAAKEKLYDAEGQMIDVLHGARVEQLRKNPESKAKDVLTHREKSMLADLIRHEVEADKSLNAFPAADYIGLLLQENASRRSEFYGSALAMLNNQKDGRHVAEMLHTKLKLLLPGTHRYLATERDRRAMAASAANSERQTGPAPRPPESRGRVQPPSSRGPAAPQSEPIRSKVVRRPEQPPKKDDDEPAGIFQKVAGWFK